MPVSATSPKGTPGQPPITIFATGFSPRVRNTSAAMATMLAPRLKPSRMMRWSSPSSIRSAVMKSASFAPPAHTCTPSWVHRKSVPGALCPAHATTRVREPGVAARAPRTAMISVRYLSTLWMNARAPGTKITVASACRST